MTVKDEVRDPWSYVIAGLAGGLTWAVVASVTAAAAPIGVAVGAAVLGAKVVSGAFVRPRRRAHDLPIQARTAEAEWVDRAEHALKEFDDICRSAPDGPIAERVRTFGDETNASTGSLERLAGQASAIRHALARIDPRFLGGERDRLTAAQQQTSDPRVRAERDRALAAVQSQVDAYERLTAALTALLARLESGTIGLEGLVARLAEVVALAETSGTAADGLDEVDSLATELEGLRAGLVEAEDVSARAIGGLAPLPTGSVQQRRRSTE